MWIGGITLSSNVALASKVSVPATALVASGGDVHRGEHLVRVLLRCDRCHAADLGGAIYTGGGVVKLPAANLTTGNATPFTDADFERAIRHGVARDGTRLYYMPSVAYSALDDADLRDAIAYLRSVPPVHRDLPARGFSFFGRMGAATHALPAAADHIVQDAPHADAPAAAPNAAYGAYLAKIGGCYECHGSDLAGGHIAVDSDAPRAANLTPDGIGSWSLPQFATAVRTGRDPAGRTLDTFMPWHALAGLSDQEVNALYAFLKTVPPVRT